MDTINSRLNEFLSKLKGVTRNKENNFSAQCPAHDDEKPSLNVEIKNNQILVHCFAGANF